MLLVEDDPDTGTLLAMALEARGASCHVAETGAAAVGELGRGRPDVLLCNLSLPDGSGLTWLPTFRELPGMTAVPAVVLSGRGSQADRAASLAAGFEKHLLKPVKLVDLIATIATVTDRNGPLALRGMLARLSDTTGCRYTSLFRFDREALVSMWTYDREHNRADAFAVITPIEQSYCTLVRQTGELVAIEDAASDPRTAGHAKRNVLATYVGAPVFGPDGAMFGTLCTYDEAPRRIGEMARLELSAAARQLETALRSVSP